jgi:hypothetical protein
MCPEVVDGMRRGWVLMEGKYLWIRKYKGNIVSYNAK